MGGDKMVFDEELPGEDMTFQGRLGRTTMSSVLWRSPSGQITSVRIYTGVNATTDPVLAERLCAGTLNWVRIPDEEQLYPVRTPVLYHDETGRRLILVLPDDFRARELAERSDLFEKLSRDTSHPIPSYVLNFEVAYGHEELARKVAPHTMRPNHDVETTPVRSVPNEYLETTVRVPNPERLDRLAAEPRQESTNEPSSPSPRAVLQAEAEAIIEQMESIDGWPEEPTATRTQPPPGDDLLDAGPVALSEELDAMPDDVFDVDDLGATVEDEPEPTADREPSQTDAESDDKPLPAQPAGPPDKDRTDQPPAAINQTADEPGEEAAQPQAEQLPKQLDHWKESDHEEFAAYVNDAGVVLAARIENDHLKDLIGQDFNILLQLHKMKRYPLVVLAVSAQERQGEPLFWLLNVLEEGHLDILERLAADFRMDVDIYDEKLHRVVQRRVHTPLEENAKLVRQKAMEHLTQMGDTEPDWDAALQQWDDPEFARLGSREHAFSDRAFSNLTSPAQTSMALGVIDWWVEPPHQDYLILVKSFPVVWWRKIKNRVVHKALEYGLWLPEHLLTWALDEGFATSRRDLLRRSIDEFCQTMQDDFKNDLDLDAENDNWQALLDEAERSGVVVVSEAEQLAKRTRQRIEETARTEQNEKDRHEVETSHVPAGVAKSSRNVTWAGKRN